ncbi:FtsW/RodA/SpoVE family cell cycle protein [Salipaludibacillus agaradhaerens]|uniref:FtsW/RodA/SpoVE family cell cycle protein n=1 Tax=Salipaludibacillus agaradhaerens TaxID=76935 RepID=UPI002151B7AD|nr:FtsW/RodA/SpoVE family cell cycle protein [Salipaludibacillus agaradhaerens]MCR6105677.1 FtsW/RodA/SpoVE family cell cycle protein [Salipaludibacillus agaradhaerens]MCR6117714.1 FtsW/RodA/SpoVE family cell cycle protein [Salipaludibacillus agaradhaerens]UJW56888.1 FtsW/RodA/SpoVE family cell cycle protein [Bacillus sp. A116_S68]
MNSSKFEEFLNKVTSKVKSKQAHSLIKKELTHHLQELSHSFQKRDSTKEEADEKAIEEMGNPFILGENLNHLHKPKIDWVLTSLFVIIAAISFLPLIGTTHSLPNYHFIGRQVIWYFLAVLVIIGFLFFDYRKLKNFWMVFYVSGVGILLYTTVFGYMMNGAQRWLSIGAIIIDVTPLSLCLFFLAWAALLSKINTFNSWLKQMIVIGLFWMPILLYMALPHFMMSVIYFFCVVAMFAFSQVHKRLALKLVVANMVIGLGFLMTLIINFRNSYVFTRLTAFFNPHDAELNFVVVKMREVLSQAGWFGNGLFNDRDFFTSAHTDFAFPYLVYSLGWIFGIALCVILLLFILRISKNAFKTKDLYGRTLVIGGAALFAVPACWNILMGFGIVPLMGVSLPFISYGGSMLLCYSAILGLILSVFRQKDIIEPTIENFN